MSFEELKELCDAVKTATKKPINIDFVFWYEKARVHIFDKADFDIIPTNFTIEKRDDEYTEYKKLYDNIEFFYLGKESQNA